MIAADPHATTAQPGEFRPLDYRRFRVDPPVVLAPMAGVTNSAFRRLCRGFGAGLYVSEMVTSSPRISTTPRNVDARSSSSPRPGA